MVSAREHNIVERGVVGFEDSLYNTPPTLVHSLILEAQKGWHRLRGHQHIERVLNGAKYRDGIEIVNNRVAA